MLHFRYISKGWNIEGTLHNQKLYNDNIALPIKNYEYIMKEIAFWNIRYLLVPDKYQDMLEKLENEMSFRMSEANRDGHLLYVSDEPSAYYLTDSRNALVISTGMQGFSAQFLNFVQGKSGDILDYTKEELLRYSLIYIIEPEINTLTKKNNFETMVTELVNNGATVMIEPLANKVFDLFGVHIDDEELKETIHIKATTEDPYDITNTMIENNSNLHRIRSLYYLDEVYANYELSDSDVSIGLIGAKNIGEGKVIFIGAHLSQYLDMVYTRNNGLGAYSDVIKENSDRVEEIYSDIFSYYGINEDYLPAVFNSVTDHHWDYNGGSFTYDSEEAQEVTVSVTYTPRWSATLDGKEIQVGQTEHLITLMLPAGQHTVELHYGITNFSIIGYIISAFGIVLLLIVLLFWNRWMRLLDRMALASCRYLQIGDTSASKLETNDFVKENTKLKETIEDVSMSEVSMSEVSMSEVSMSEVSMAEVSMSEVSMAEVSMSEVSISEETATEVTATSEAVDEYPIQVEDDIDTDSIQFRTFSEDDIKVDIIVIDKKLTPDLISEFYDNEESLEENAKEPEEEIEKESEKEIEEKIIEEKIIEEKIIEEKIIEDRKEEKEEKRKPKVKNSFDRSAVRKVPNKDVIYKKHNNISKTRKKRRKPSVFFDFIKKKRYIKKTKKQ